MHFFFLFNLSPQKDSGIDIVYNTKDLYFKDYNSLITRVSNTIY